MLFPQPSELTIDEPMEPVEGECGKCGEATVFGYTLVDYRGWLRVTKCRSCLNVRGSERIQPPAQAG
ncbi:MAG: hypothetical protein J0H06_09365 [Actinobacteria bacterium]|nr:hypothetical protein [Actinomycetota bacterium]